MARIKKEKLIRAEKMTMKQNNNKERKSNTSEYQV